MPFLEANGGRFHYQLDGPTGAPVLMLANSLGTDMQMWEPQLPAFAKRFRVLRHDTRGHGDSAVRSDPCTIERLAHDVLALLDALGIASTHFCGLSMGGMIGQWLGVNAPQRLHRLVLCNTSARIAPRALWDARIAAVRKGGMTAIADAVIERWFTPEFRERAPEAVEPVRRTLLATSAEGYAACCAAVRDMDQRATIAGIRTATLVIAGCADAATPPSDGRYLAEQIPGAHYVELNAAHLSNIEAAERFTQTVVDYLGA
jgi:3-oxoadipate enol-lactonase